MALLPSEEDTEKRINQACQWRTDENDLEIDSIQALYIRQMNHLFSGCTVYARANQHFLHIDTLLLSDKAHNEMVNRIHSLLCALEKDYVYPKSIDQLYFNSFSSDKVQSLLGEVCKEVALVKDENASYILIGKRSHLNEAKKALVKLDQLLCHQFFLPDPISHFLEKEREKNPDLNVYSVLERMLGNEVQVHPKQVLSQIKEKKRIKNIHPNNSNSEFVYRCDCPFNPSFHVIIEEKSILPFLKKVPASNRIVLVNPALWNSLPFVKERLVDVEVESVVGDSRLNYSNSVQSLSRVYSDSFQSLPSQAHSDSVQSLSQTHSNSNQSPPTQHPIWTGTNPSITSSANPQSLTTLQHICQNSVFRVMNDNQLLESFYETLGETNRSTNILCTEETFINEGTLQCNLIQTQFEQLFSVVDTIQESISIVLPVLLPPEHADQDVRYLTQLFCLLLQKARTIENAPDVSVYFLIRDNKQISAYKSAFEKLLSSAVRSTHTQKESIVLLGMKKEMAQVGAHLTSLLNDLSSFAATWHRCVPQSPPSPFSILSWNILAADYAQAKYWTHVPPAFLRSSYRRPLILQFLAKQHPSVFCLQECDCYYHFWKGALSTIGYYSLYAQRTGSKKDGCCIAYDPSCLEYENHWILHYDDLAEVTTLDVDRIGFIENGKNCVFEEDEGIIKRAATYQPVDVKSDKNKVATGELKSRIESCHTMSVGLIALFRDKQTKQEIVVATTHLFWNPQYYQIKLYQSMYLLKAIQLVKEKEGKDLPVFVTMDSNSLPYSSVYNYYCSLYWFGSLSSRNSFIPLRSAYEQYYHNREPLITNYSYDFIGCLDYIFYHPGSVFEKEGVMELPSFKVFRDLDSLPSVSIPSDHIPIELLGRIHSVKRVSSESPVNSINSSESPVDSINSSESPVDSINSSKSPSTPITSPPCRSELNRPFFKHVYCSLSCSTNILF